MSKLFDFGSTPDESPFLKASRDAQALDKRPPIRGTPSDPFGLRQRPGGRIFDAPPPRRLVRAPNGQLCDSITGAIFGGAMTPQQAAELNGLSLPAHVKAYDAHEAPGTIHELRPLSGRGNLGERESSEYLDAVRQHDAEVTEQLRARAAADAEQARREGEESLINAHQAALRRTAGGSDAA